MENIRSRIHLSATGKVTDTGKLFKSRLEGEMSIITISRGSYSHGELVAKQVAEKLGYKCIGRDVLIAASKEFNIPEIKLQKAIQDAPSFLDRFTYGREKFIAYFRAAILKHLKQGDTVYYGLAGHFFLQNIPHVVKVRIIANIEERLRIVMQREDISRQEAQAMVRRLDEERRRWGLSLYGIDSWDSRLYDLVINIDRITIEDAVNMICDTARLGVFQPTPASQRKMEELLRLAEAKLAEIDPSMVHEAQ
jgi:cytidylate kinase